MRTLAKRISGRIFNISVYEYKAYIYFMLILLFSMLDHIITQVMINCYGYVEGPFYKRSEELILESIVLTLIKVIFSTMLAKALVDNPIERKAQITLLGCKVETEDSRVLLVWLVIGMELYFMATAMYDTINYILITFVMK